MADELTPKQIEFLKYYNDPTSETFSNALQSALKAGFSQNYAENITVAMPNWLEENVGRRKRMFYKAERRIDSLIDSKNEKIALGASALVVKTLGKEEGYSERTELTGKDGKDLGVVVLPPKNESTLEANNETSGSPSEDRV